MKNVKTLKAVKVLEGVSAFRPYSREVCDGSAKLEWVSTDKECSIPRLHFSWIPEYWIWDVTDQEAQALAAARGFKIETSRAMNGEPEGKFVRAMGSKPVHRWFMNFRRYAWSSTDDEEGLAGYGSGQTYANGPVLLGMDTSEEFVLRDAFVVSAKELMDELPYAFQCFEVEGVLSRLYYEGLEHLKKNGSPFTKPNRGRSYGHIPQIVIHD